MDYLLLIAYLLFSIFHSFSLWLFVIALFRTFFVRYSPYSATLVGLTTLANAMYGGCPFTEIENALARLVDMPQKLVGEIYFVFGDLAPFIRVLLFISSVGLLYNAYRVWYKVETPVRIQNIFRSPKIVKQKYHAI